MAKKKAKQKADENPDAAAVEGFESALAAVEDVVEQLESGELGLSESLAQYERGIEKIKLCHRALQQAEQRISVLVQVDEDGTPTVEPVEMASDRTQRAAANPPAGASQRGARKRSPPQGDVDDLGGLF